MTALVRTLHESHIALTGVTEARLLGSDCSKGEGYTILHSGGLHHVNGIALVISAPLTTGLMNWSPISDRLLRARFAHRHGHISAIVACAATNGASDEGKDAFYDQLTSAVSGVPPHDILLVLRDQNAVTGQDPMGFEAVNGEFSSGTPNDNTIRLLSYCASPSLALTGSKFRQEKLETLLTIYGV